MGKSYTDQAINDIFTYHPADSEQLIAYQGIRATAKELFTVIQKYCPECADRSAALRLVREAVMTANAAVALKGLV